MMRIICKTIAMIAASYFLSTMARAQVITDGTMGAARSLTGPNYAIPSRLGQTVGSNLFHSFSRFNVFAGESATFSGPASIRNIISRVTGGQASTIDGLLGSTITGANLYLVNPKGIMFGPNATLDVSGSFYATTADYLKLGAAGRFDATTPANTVLTVDPPSVFGFLGPRPAPVTVDDSSLSVPGEMSLVGGDITITNETKDMVISSPGGLNLVSVASMGEARLSPTGIDTASFGKMGVLAISSASPNRVNAQDIGTTDFHGGPTGRIFISAGTFVADGAYIVADTWGEENGKGIWVECRDKIFLINNSIMSASTAGNGGSGGLSLSAPEISLANSQLASDSYPSDVIATGNAGSITIDTKTLNVSDSGMISSSTLGKGNAGSIKILNADAVNVTMNGIIDNSTSGDGGDAGIITIDTKTLNVSDSGMISSSTLGKGNAGSINIIKADSVNVTRNGTIVTSTSGDDGDAGSITIDTKTLNVSDRGMISSSTLGKGNAGAIKILNADAVNISDSGFITSLTAESATGDAGIITIDAKRLNVSDYGIISTSTLGKGNAGSINVLNADVINISDFGFVDSSTAESATGDAGIIRLDAKSLNVSDYGIITTSTLGKGNAGSINILNADVINISDFGFVDSSTAESTTGDAGIIRLDAKALNVSDYGMITTSTLGKGNAGSINVLNADAVNISTIGSIKSATDGNATGSAGSISIDTKTLNVSNWGTITTNTNSEGNAGTIKLKVAKAIDINNASVTSMAESKGNAGDISIFTKTLEVENGGVISSSAGTDKGNAGNVTIDATESVSVIGHILDGTIDYPSNISSSSSGTGHGGAISLTTPSLIIREGGMISARGTSTGPAGSLNINVANKITLDGGFIRTEAAKSDGGNITIDPVLIDMRNSSITTSVNGGAGNGGNISIAAGFILLDHSNVKADAIGGNGGNINIASDVFLRDPQSLVTASSQLGLAGRIGINAPLVDLSGNLVSLPERMPGENDMTPRQCAIEDESSSSFVVGEAIRTSRPDRNLVTY